VHVIDRRDSGREFQIVGTQNALSPNLVLVLGTMKSVVSAERSLLRDRSRRRAMFYMYNLYSGNRRRSVSRLGDIAGGNGGQVKENVSK